MAKKVSLPSLVRNSPVLAASWTLSEQIHLSPGGSNVFHEAPRCLREASGISKREFLADAPLSPNGESTQSEAGERVR